MGEVMNSFTLDLSSDGDKDFAQVNKHNDFRINFPKPLPLETGQWSVALTKVQYSRYIANIDDQCFFVIWNGKYETKIYLSKWHCSDISTLITMINEKMKEINFQSVDDTRKALAKIRVLRSSENSITSQMNESAERTAAVNNVEETQDSDYVPTRYIEAAVIERMMREFTTSKNPAFPSISINGSRKSLPKLSITFNTLIPGIETQQLTMGLPSGVPQKVAQNTSFNSAVELFNHLTDYLSLNVSDMKEPPSYTEPFLAIDKFGKISINSPSPDFDFYFSDSLRIKLGFIDDRFSMARYERRRFFHSYLLYQSENVAFVS